jgi:hypothetical protein
MSFDRILKVKIALTDQTLLFIQLLLIKRALLCLRDYGLNVKLYVLCDIM